MLVKFQRNSYIGGFRVWCSHSEEWWAVSYNTEYVTTIHHSNVIPKHLSLG